MESLSRRDLPRVACAVALLACVGCSRPTDPSSGEPATAEVFVARPIVMPIVEWDQYVGRLDAIDSVDVQTRVDGYLESTHFDEGQLVERGDLLAIIDPRPFQAELNAARARSEEAKARLTESEARLRQSEAERLDRQAQLELAITRLQRAKRLSRGNAISEDELDVRESERLQAGAAVEAANAAVESAKAGIETAKAAIETSMANEESAQLNLQYTRIRAPISGRISRRFVTVGNLVSTMSTDKSLITTIVSINPIHCYFDANEQAFLKYARLAREGKRASSRESKNPIYLALVDEEGFPHTGHMDFVDNRIDPNTGTMRGRAILSNDDGMLTPGLFASVRLPGSGRYEAVMIPDSAIGSDQSEKFVYTIDDQGQPVRTVVQLGPISHGLRIIRSGLKGDEPLVVRGLQRIYPGVRVKAVEETIDVDLAHALPDDYEPVPKDEWLSVAPAAVPAGIEPNAEPYRDVENATGRSSLTPAEGEPSP